MSNYKKILVAVDLSEESEQVLQAATDVAQLHKAEIGIIHVTDNPVTLYSQWSDYVVPYSEEKIRELLFSKLTDLVEKSGLDKSLITVDFGRAVDVIIDKAEKENYDLIILGSHGRHGVKLLLGSTANGVLHHATCDVLAVRIREVIDQN